MRALPKFVSALVAIALVPVWLSAQQPATISGRVTTDAGTGLAGASVLIEGMNVGSTTDEQGRYSLSVPSARVQGQTVRLTARRLGYSARTSQIPLTPGPITLSFVLPLNPLQLGEVVVTGAGTSTEVEKLGNVRNSVSPVLIEKSNEANLVQALAGKAPNVQVAQSAGDPGAGSSITIRGLRTLNGSTQPLFVIDGVPMNNSTFSTTNFNPIDAGGGGVGGQDNGGQLEGTSAPNRMVDLNPGDIESVEILKGAAAAAIYGSTAANGVILITTKRGEAGVNRYSLRSSISNDKISKKYPLQTSFGLGNSNAAVGGLRSWGPRIATSYDHADEAFDTGHVIDNTLSMSGGNDRTTFFLSGNSDRNQGIFVGPNNFYDRTTARVNATHRLTDRLNVGGNFSYSDTRGHFTQRGNNVNGLLLGLFRTPPDFNNIPWLDPVSGLHRSYTVPNADVSTAGQTRTFDNPFFTLYEELNDGKASRTFGNVNAEYLANDWLKFNYILGTDYSNDERLEGCPAECSDVATGGRVTEGKLVNYLINSNLTGTAKWQASSNFAGTFTLGQALSANNYRTFSVVGRGLIATKPFSVLNTLTRDPPSDYQTQIHDESYFGQATFDLFNQLFLTTAARNDGSTTFGTANRRNWFPKASAAWTFTKAYQPPFIDFGKLRIAYGEAGQEPQPYLTSATFSGTNLVGGIAQGTGFTPTQSGLGGLFYTFTKPASVLKPERTKETEGGFDLGFWGQKADFSATWYKSKTTDVILVTPIPPSTGFSSEAKNAGVFQNSGTELSLNVRPLATSNYGWDVGFGWARNRSLVKSIAGADFLVTDFYLEQTVAQVGRQLGVIRGYGFVRCGITNPDSYPTLNLATVCAGQPYGATYIDDGTKCSRDPGMPCGDDDARIIADPNPRWTGNVHSSFRVGKWELSGLLDVKKGGDVWNGTRSALYSYGTHGDTENRAICTGTHNVDCTGNLHAFGTAGFYPGPVVGPGAGSQIPIGQNWYRNGLGPCAFSGYDESCIEDGGFVKLREISVAYTMAQPWVSRMLGVSTVDLRISGRNLKTWTKYTGLDPETTVGGGTTRVGGTDYFNLPLTRSVVFTVGLNR
ncbi:MAG TPA: SusC/RagA family TonB-linked outer membrane protein [Dehalococcoidia bacterium]